MQWDTLHLHHFWMSIQIRISYTTNIYCNMLYLLLLFVAFFETPCICMLRLWRKHNGFYDRLVLWLYDSHYEVTVTWTWSHYDNFKALQLHHSVSNLWKVWHVTILHRLGWLDCSRTQHNLIKSAFSFFLFLMKAGFGLEFCIGPGDQILPESDPTSLCKLVSL